MMPTAPAIHPPLLKVDPAPASARKHLRDAILSQCPGLSSHVADIISEAAAEPGEARKALASPLYTHTPHGRLKLFPVRVYAPLAVPGVANPRLHARRTPPFADSSARPAIEPVLADAGQPVLRIALESREHGEQSLREARSWVTGKDAVELEALIRPYGVQRPVTLIVQEFAHADASDSVYLLAGLDGSTRLAICHTLLGIDTADVPYRLWTNGRIRGRVLREFADISSRPADELLKEPELIDQHRALTVPALIVIGFEPNPGGTYDDMMRALDALVSMEHLGHSRDWDESSQQDELSRISLREAVEAGVITERERLYMLGALTKEQCTNPSSGHPADVLPVEEDERAIFISHVVHSNAMREPIRKAYYGLLVKDEESRPGRLPKNARVDIATELTFLTFRSEVGDDEVERRGPRSILHRTWGWSEFRDPAKLRRPNGRSLEDLRDGALDELLGAAPQLGPDRIELAMAGAYWLIAKGVLKRDSRETDNRSGTAVLKAMLSCEDGIHQLYRAIVDGRADEPAIFEVAPGTGGAIRTDGYGAPIPASDRTLRSTYTGAQPQIGQTPEEKLRASLDSLRSALEQAEDAVQQVKENVTANGYATFLDAAVGLREVDAIADKAKSVVVDLEAWAREVDIEQRVRAGRARSMPGINVLVPPHQSSAVNPATVNGVGVTP
jgi:hypothetical protein